MAYDSTRFTSLQAPTLNEWSQLLDNDDYLKTEIERSSYCFHAYPSATQLGNASGAFVKVAYNTEEYDYNSDFNTTTNTYTAPVDGVYSFSAASRINTAGATLTASIITLYKNGSEAKRGKWTSINSGNFGGIETIAVEILLSAGDAITIYGYGTTSSGTWNMSHSSSVSYFSGHLVHAT